MTSSCSSVKKLRSFVLRTTSAAAYFARMTLVRLNDEGFLPLKESILQDPIPKLHPLRFKDMPISLTTNFTKYSTLIKKMYNMKTPTTAKAIIWNTMEWLEDSTIAEIKNKSIVPIFPIGPLHRMVSARTSVLKEDFNMTVMARQASGRCCYLRSHWKYSFIK